MTEISSGDNVTITATSVITAVDASSFTTRTNTVMRMRSMPVAGGTIDMPDQTSESVTKTIVDDRGMPVSIQIESMDSSNLPDGYSVPPASQNLSGAMNQICYAEVEPGWTEEFDSSFETPVPGGTLISSMHEAARASERVQLQTELGLLDVLPIAFTTSNGEGPGAFTTETTLYLHDEYGMVEIHTVMNISSTIPGQGTAAQSMESITKLMSIMTLPEPCD